MATKSAQSCKLARSQITVLMLMMFANGTGIASEIAQNIDRPSLEQIPLVDSTSKAITPYCGVYSLYGACNSLGTNIPFSSLLSPRYIGSKDGSTAQELEKAARDHGLHALSLSGLGASSIRSTRLPLILHVAQDGQLRDYKHWVLFLGMREGKASIIDAPSEERLVPMAELLAIWDGVAIVVSGKPISVGTITAPEHLSILLHASLALGVVAIVLLAHGCIKQSSSHRTVAHRSAIRGATAQAAVLLAVSAATSLSLQLLNPDSLLANPEATSFVAAANIDSFFPRLSVHQVNRLLEDENVTVVDARYSGDYNRGHLPKAISVPINSNAVERAKMLTGVSKDRPLVVYCQSKNCQFDEVQAVRLAREGFTDIRIFTGGWSEWRKSEYHSE